MADKLTADQFAEFTKRNIRAKVTRTLTVDNDSISLTDITDYVRSWGRLKTTIFNKHPKDTGTLDFPLVTVEVDNSGGEFSPGGLFFPGGTSDFASTVAQLTVEIIGTTFVDFTGAVLEPEITPSGIVNLVIEHPLAAMASRKWVREDRIGGDTGIDWNFAS